MRSVRPNHSSSGDRTGILITPAESRSTSVHLCLYPLQPHFGLKLGMRICTGRSHWRATSSPRRRRWQRGWWIASFREIRLRLSSTWRVNWLNQSTPSQRVVPGALSRLSKYFLTNCICITDEEFSRRIFIEMLQTRSICLADCRRVPGQLQLPPGLGCDGGRRPAINTFTSVNYTNVCDFEIFHVLSGPLEGVLGYR